MRKWLSECELALSVEPERGDADEPHMDGEATWTAVQRRVRQRRLEWARGSATVATSSSVPSTAITTASGPLATWNGACARAWSVNVEVIERERVLRGWTQRELARNAHVDQGTLCDLLARRRRPTFGTVQAICTALRLTRAQVIEFASNS